MAVTWEREGAEFLVNTTTASWQWNPSIAALQGGGYVITWTASLQDASTGTGVYAQLYAASGEAVGGETRVNTTTVNNQLYSSVAALEGGGYVITWVSQHQDGSAGGIYAQRYDASGGRVGGETLINSTTANDQMSPSIAALEGGGYVITWASQHQDGSGWGIYAQRYDAAGAAQGGETRINSTTLNDQDVPSVTGLVGGGYVITWASNTQDGDDYGIYAQRYDASGVAQGGEIRVNTTTANSQNEPCVAGLESGGYVITWVGYNQDGSGTGIYAQRFDAAGAAAGGEILINTVTLNNQYAPAVAGIDGGGYVVTWQSYTYDDYRWDIYAQVYDDSGVAQGPQTLINTTTVDTQEEPSVAALDGGSYVVAWRSQDLDEIGDIFAQRFDPKFEGTAGNDIMAGFSGDDAINGHGGDDVLSGNGGNDTINGGTGADTMTGGAGNDTYTVDDAGDVVTEQSNGGLDLVYAGVSHTLTANVENLTLTGSAAINGTGNALRNTLIGNSAANVLTGGGGNDWLNGGLGADAMAGGAHNDTYVVNEAGDTVTEALGAGADTVRASVNYTLPANVERLLLIGSAAINGTGNALNNIITGNAAVNSIDGGDGSDRLYGRGGNDVLTGGIGSDTLDGGRGADTMAGGAHHDTYHVDDAGDVITELSGEGADTVRSIVSYTLTTNVEHLTLTGTAAINGTGNGLGNIITGNSGINNLDGGDGNDQLNGGDGDDVITGGAGHDRLDGGAGGDTMAGGSGNDTYFVDDEYGGDGLIELAGQGTDTVYSSVTTALPDNVERLILTGTAGTGLGNDLGNVITGNDDRNELWGMGGNDRLSGLDGFDYLHGGLGNDVLTGGGAKDTFYFESALDAASNVDKITDYTIGEDSIRLKQAVFSEIGLGWLASTAFVAGTAAQDADDRIIYDSATGNIYYDADGNGAGAQVLFAQVTAGTALTHSDFLIFA